MQVKLRISPVIALAIYTLASPFCWVPSSDATSCPLLTVAPTLAV